MKPVRATIFIDGDVMALLSSHSFFKTVRAPISGGTDMRAFPNTVAAGNGQYARDLNCG